MPFRRKRRSQAASSDVERAMQAVVADDNAATRASLYDALLATTLYVATPEAPASNGSWRVVEEDEELAMITLDGSDGPILPVFTSLERLESFGHVGGYAQLPSRDLFNVALASGMSSLAVNLDSDTTGTIQRHELAALASGRFPLDGGEVVAPGTEMRIGQPAHPPSDEVVAAVRRAVAGDTRVCEAWLYLMQLGEDEPGLTVGVVPASDVDEDALQAAIRAIAQAAGDESPDTHGLLFMVIDQDTRSDLRDGAGELVFTRLADA